MRGYQTEEQFLEPYRRMYRERMTRLQADRLKLAVQAAAERVAECSAPQRRAFPDGLFAPMSGDGAHTAFEHTVRTVIGNAVQAMAGVTRYSNVPEELVDDLLPAVDRIADVLADECRRIADLAEQRRR